MCWCAPAAQRWSLISTTKVFKSAFATPVQAGTPDPWVVPGQTPLAEKSSYSWASEYGSRHPIEVGAEAWGMDSSHEVVKKTWRAWPGSGGPACDSRDAALSPLVLSDPSSSTEAGCQGTDVAEASSVHLSPIALLLGVLQRVRRTGKRAHFWLISFLDGSLFPSWFYPPLSGGGYDLSPRAQSGGSYGRDPRGGTSRSFWSLNWGCWDHPPSQSSLYKETVCLEVEAFNSWCGDSQLDLVNCPVCTVLEFLQACFSAGLTHSTLEIYVAAIAAYHAPRVGQSEGRHPLVTRFLHGALRLRSPAREAYAKWWIRMLFHSLESSDLPAPWGSRLTLQKLAFRMRSPPTLATPGSAYSRPSCTLPH